MDNENDSIRKEIIANISELVFDDKNANKGTTRGREMLESSLRKYGANKVK
jgi:hypothetical protein